MSEGKITKELITDMLKRLATSFEEETRASDQYKDLFERVDGDDFTGLLREVELKMSSIALDALLVVSDKRGRPTTTELMSLFYALPFIVKKMNDTIRNEQGPACCVDKTYHALNRIINQ